MTLIAGRVAGQLSPGPLTTAHESLEGLSNCTQCHDLGNKVPDQKCLACHEEIASLINDDRGFHASSEVTEKTCIDCHSEHHGKKFEIARFDETTFDHDLTGYELLGQHDVIECRDCHIPENIKDADLKNRENTFLGLTEDCLSCHNDFHQGSLSSTCVDCHDFDAFRPAVGFDHDEAAFILSGAHMNVDCIECHPMEMKNGVEFQVFNGIEFNTCVSCHDDAHNGNLTNSCTECHTENSFEEFIGQRKFNHNRTQFRLNGKHNSVNCFTCHTENLGPQEIFQDRLSIKEADCVQCHDDVHEGKFGTNCVKCHQETSFYDLKDMDNFNHDVTDFPLVGLHQQVDCKTCHTSNYTEAIDFTYCRNCHNDYHSGEFINDDPTSDCIDCHTLEKAFTHSSFGLEEHQESASFQLEGAHLATPCFACHISEEKWTFRDIGQNCVDCHDDIHKDFISEQYYPENSCTSCHTTETWSDVTFDHDQTEWELEGQHAQVACRQCHVTYQLIEPKLLQVFQGLDQACASCHDNPHGVQFEENGETNCINCHTTIDWIPTKFDHSVTDFPLDGRHAEIDCKACHKAVENESGEVEIQYQIERFDCIHCHG